MPREFLDYLTDILNTTKSIDGFVTGMTYTDFLADEKTVFAVIQGFEIIGEAAKDIPQEIQVQYPEIDWTSMAKMRDLLIHHYFGIQYPILWETIENRIPSLLSDLPKIIGKFESE
jgi:uncharacterized protein with HEPN domain